MTLKVPSPFELNASPCFGSKPAASGPSPIAGVVLTGGDVDAIAGLLTLRERQPFTILATARVQLFHGSLWQNDEMIRAGIGTKTGRRIGQRAVVKAAGWRVAFDGMELAL